MQKIFFNLQAIRFLAACSVLTFHTEIFYRRAGGTWVIDPLRIGYARIDMFFIISGFVTCHVAQKMSSLREAAVFLYRRSARIYTNYWPVMLVMICIAAVFMPFKLYEYNYLKGVLLIYASTAQRILAVSWTLSQELLFYILFAAACMLPRRYLTVVILVFVALVINNQFVSPPYRFRILLSPMLLEFLAGATVRLLLPKVGHTERRNGVALFCASVALLFACAYICRQIGVTLFSRSLIVGPAAAFLVFAAANLERAGVVANARLSHLGNYAYSIYLVHFPILVLASYTIQPAVAVRPWSAELVYGSLIGAIVAYAIVHYHCVEVPLYRLATGWLQRKKAPSSVAAVA